MRHLFLLLLPTIVPLAAQTPYTTLIPFPQAASCALKIVGTFNGANAATIKAYSEGGALLTTTAADVSTRKTVTHSIPSTTNVASVAVESANGTAVLAQCQEIIGWWPGPFFAFRPIFSNFTLQGDDFRNKGFPLTVGLGIRSTPVLQYSDTPSAATIDIKTGPYAVQQILSRNGTGRNSLDALLGTSIMVNAQTATAKIAQPDTGSLAGYERIYTGLTSYTLPHGEADYEHVLPNHYSNIGAAWINLVSVLANKPTVVYFTAKASDGRTLDVQRRVLRQDERFIAYPESIFATTKDLAWILVRADQRVETTSFYIQGTQIMTVNGLTRNECGFTLVSAGAGPSSTDAIVNVHEDIYRDTDGLLKYGPVPVNGSVTSFDAEGKLIANKQVTIPIAGKLATSGNLAEFFGISEAAATRISSGVFNFSGRVCGTGTSSSQGFFSATSLYPRTSSSLR